VVVIPAGQFGVAQRLVGPAAVVVAFRRAGRQRDADLEGAKRRVETPPAVGADPTRELGPQVLRLKVRGSLELLGGRLQGAGREQRAAERVMLPGGSRGELGAAPGGCAGQVGQAQCLGVRPALEGQHRAGAEEALGLVQRLQGFAPGSGGRPRRQPDAQVRPEDRQVQEVGPEPPGDLRLQVAT
jgi:hypothetical protein